MRYSVMILQNLVVYDLLVDFLQRCEGVVVEVVEGVPVSAGQQIVRGTANGVSAGPTGADGGEVLVRLI